MINCKNLEKFIVDYLDDQLPAETKQIFTQHIEECEHCADYLRDFEKTISLSKSAFADDSAKGEEIPEKLVDAILAASRKTG